MAKVKLVVVFKSGAVHETPCDVVFANGIIADFLNESQAHPDDLSSNVNSNLDTGIQGVSYTGKIRARAADISAMFVEAL